MVLDFNLEARFEIRDVMHHQLRRNRFWQIIPPNVSPVLTALKGISRWSRFEPSPTRLLGFSAWRQEVQLDAVQLRTSPR